jgi:hypothetical protein
MSGGYQICGQEIPEEIIDIIEQMVGPPQPTTYPFRFTLPEEETRQKHKWIFHLETLPSLDKKTLDLLRRKYQEECLKQSKGILNYLKDHESASAITSLPQPKPKDTQSKKQLLRKEKRVEKAKRTQQKERRKR